MAKLDGDGQGGVSLFPMFNILACTLGVMVFILATVATVSLGADKAVEIVYEGGNGPGGGAPSWMEWDGRSLVLYPSGDRIDFPSDLDAFPTYEAASAHISSELTGTRVGAGVADVAMNRSGHVILLVRPSGFASVDELRTYLELLRIDVVLEPINQDWRRVQVR